MGLLVDGVWHDQWYDTAATGGRFQRQASRFRNFITADGASGPTGEGGFPAAAGRYHLYVSLACPWAHRTLIMRALKKLDAVISVSVVDPFMGSEGWTFDAPEPLLGKTRLHEIYTAADPTYTGRVTVPVLWDKERATFVSNESAEIIRMFNSAFSAFTDVTDDYYPEPLRPAIDAINTVVYDEVNNGVYKAGFATTQAAYEEAVGVLFRRLDALEEILAGQAYLAGDAFTEADIRLFTTLVRFDAVYVGHFKCNIRRIADYPSLSSYLRALYQRPEIRPTVNFTHIKRHYYESHKTINPTGIVPLGPLLDLDAPHDRDRFRSRVS
ncbi:MULTISPECIES: glutathione S-transferase family protein [unclassified Xanthobacter]|uniref:glutathione S-transferase family protein n=1 Tax=unclassified Xanthobacter TaxID=2623496 RepID=UPI001EDD660E|nr:MULTISPECIES: glutathione S-transferase family protein [unclassified Xanthobacter]